ncbi:MAG: GAF domain-containing protein [Gemmatimonadetes bacterium]|nr:GAF domain-containing protein [Gemmatimonadota bacterium]
MDLLDAVVQIHESEDPSAAFRALTEALAPRLPLRSAVWIGPDGDEVWHAWLAGAERRSALARTARAVVAPEIRPCSPGEEALFLPLRGNGTLVLVGESRAFGEDAGAWERVAAALDRVAERERRLRHAEEERDTLRLRAEESEALHVLGLAANRTLDPDEVLTLVARFTRTLLGAHYVTVHTSSDGHIRTAAAVGLRVPHPEEDPFASRVVEAGKPLSVGTGGDAFQVDDFPLHATEGMCVGLGVPLSLFGETFGALVIGYRRLYPLAARDTRLALTLAGHAAVAISNARLHQQIADRSRELERAYEELRWSSQAKERFFASMSHELRTPLNAILGYHSLLLDGVVGEVPPAQRSMLDRAHRATQNLLALVNDVLDLSKIEAGKMELMIRPVPLREIVEDALSTTQLQAEQKGLRIVLPPLDSLPSLSTDADRVRQILVNLFSNAVKFTDRGEITVAVGDAPAAEDGWHPEPEEGAEEAARALEIRVTDTGPGIAAENRERIFHEFEQVSGATARGGTGLGLPISRKLARLLGGDLLVESTLGEGSTFILRLPVDYALSAEGERTGL